MKEAVECKVPMPMFEICKVSGRTHQSGRSLIGDRKSSEDRAFVARYQGFLHGHAPGISAKQACNGEKHEIRRTNVNVAISGYTFNRCVSRLLRVKGVGTTSASAISSAIQAIT